MSIASNLENIKNSLTAEVTLVAVSKTKPIENITEAYNAGQRIFGENKIQEMAAKYDVLPKDIEWHMIGHVQTNKIKYMAPFVSLIHGVDRQKVLKEVNKEAIKNNRVISCLLQVHIAEEETKFGFNPAEVEELINQLKLYPNVKVIGLMGMASNTSNQEKVAEEFSKLNQLFKKLKPQLGEEFNTLSMGMSGDYTLAIKEGSNMIRVGSSIFGARNYAK